MFLPPLSFSPSFICSAGVFQRNRYLFSLYMIFLSDIMQFWCFKYCLCISQILIFQPFLEFWMYHWINYNSSGFISPFQNLFFVVIVWLFFFFLVSVISNHIYPIAQARNLGVIFSFSPFLTTYIKVDPFRLLRFHTCLSIATIAIPSQIHFIFLLGIFLGIFLTGLTSESNLSLFLYILYIAARVIFLNDGFDHITSILKKSSHILMTWGLPT